MNLRQTLVALGSLALVLPACKDDIKPDAREGASAAPSSTASAQARVIASSAPSASAASTSVAQAPTSVDASGMPVSTTGVLSAGFADGVLKAGSQPVIKVVSVGDEPREALSYDLKENKKQTSGMRMNLEMTMGIGDKTMPATKLPQIGMNIDLVTGKKDPNGDIQVTGTISKVAIKGADASEEQLAKAIQPAMDSMKGLTIKYFVSPKGRARDVQVNTPPNADPKATQMLDQMKQSFDSMVAPLPDDPVGVGGSWIVATRLTTGADILQYTTYTLKSRTGAKVVLDTQIKQFAGSPTLSAPGVGNAGTITKFLSSGNGTTSIDLGSLAPDKGTGNVDGSMVISGGQMGAMTVDTKVRIEFGAPVP